MCCGLSGREGAERKRILPKISVLMAVYRPNRDWLEQQLVSISNQTLPEIELLIRDDCPQEPVGEQVFEPLKKRMPVHYRINEKNRGPGITFALLVEETQSDYIAFCDQDDIWMPEKLEMLLEELERNKAAACYCDLSVIDAQGNQIASDVRQVRTGDVFLEGKNLAKKLFVKNCIYGCSMLMPTILAKQALPLPEGMGHDHWFSLWAASKGEIIHLKRPLVRYRLHGNNQSNTLSRIHTKKDYLEQRIMRLQRQTKQCMERFEDNPDLESYIFEIEKWTIARQQWFCGKGDALPALWKGRNFSKKAVWFELAVARMPEPIFECLMRRLQNL